MSDKVICECTDPHCSCEGRCVAPAKIVIVPISEDDPINLAVCRCCARRRTQTGEYNYSTRSETEIPTHVLR